MKKTIALTLTVAALTLSACAPAPAPEPVTDQDYGGKVDSGHTGTSGVVTLFRGCPEWAPIVYRGDLYCLKNYPYR
jgi:hypothetical protein